MRFLRRNRFHDLVSRQLDIVELDHAELFTEALDAELAWSRSERDGAEEAYGDYQLVVDSIADVLLDVRETYAHGLDDRSASEYRAAFNHEAMRRFRRYSSLLADLDEV